MKLRNTVLFIGIGLFALAAIARFAASDLWSESTTYIIEVLLVAVILSMIIGFFIVRSLRSKLKNLNNLRSEYNAAYLCMMQADPINVYIIVSDNEKIKVITNDKKRTLIMDLTKQYVNLTVGDVKVSGIRKQEGLTIGMNPEFIEDTGAVELVLLDDSKKLTWQPLRGAALEDAVRSLAK